MRTLEDQQLRHRDDGYHHLGRSSLVWDRVSSVPMLFEHQPITQFADSAGLNTGDKVRINGMDVGSVRTLAIRRGHILVGFSVGDNTIGTESRLAIRTDTC